MAELRIQDEFLRRHPAVKLVRAEGIKLENVVSEVTTVMMVAGRIAPDILSMNFRSADTFVRKGMVAPLDAFCDAEAPAVREEILARIPEQIFPVINIMLGDLQRIPIYGQRGFQIPMDIPARVWTAYEELVALGFDKHLISA